MKFTTHKHEVIEGKRLSDALNAVADDWAALCRAIRDADDYASHVSEREKDLELARGLKRANAIRQGDIRTFAVWQRVNEKLTGECVALLK